MTILVPGRLFLFSAACVLLAVLLLLPSPTEGQYCTSRGCCPGRDDDCTTPYFDTLCYCDVFCNTTAMDCCPDFWYYCLGGTLPRPTRRPLEQQKTDYCISSGVIYNPGDSLEINCNTCTCTLSPDGNADFVCENNVCLIDPTTINDVNSDYYLGWRASNYSFLWGLTQSEGVLYRLGTFPPGRAVSEMAEVNIETDGRLPESFDARESWPGLIGEVTDQGNCGSSWAISTASVASDRLAIQSDGDVRLSEQHLLSCDIRGQRGCSGGYLDRAWFYMRRAGVLSRACYPYSSGLADDTVMNKLQCRVRYGSTQCPEFGVTSDLYRSTPPYRIAAREVDIMTEIYKNGPVQATFNVKNDFFVYNRGVYRNVKPEFTASQSDPNQAGWHSVKIVGWGIDRSDPFYPVKYWLCTNSWGRNWGEQGMFRIVRGVNECEIESFVLGVWMQVGNNHMSG